jgi:hypothetical protein
MIIRRKEGESSSTLENPQDVYPPSPPQPPITISPLTEKRKKEKDLMQTKSGTLFSDRSWSISYKRSRLDLM